MNKVLVTGGAGYIGSHACKALAAAGYVPVTYDNLVTGWEDAVKFGPFEKGDLLDRSRLDEVFAEHKPVAVMHFAALSQVGESMKDPGVYWRNNVVGSLNLIEAAVTAGCLDFVFSSTCATYGEQDGVTLDENCVQEPINAYGASKRRSPSTTGTGLFVMSPECLTTSRTENPLPVPRLNTRLPLPSANHFTPKTCASTKSQTCT